MRIVPNAWQSARRARASAAILIVAAFAITMAVSHRDSSRAAAGIPVATRACALPPQPARFNAHPGMVWVPGGSFAFGDLVYPEEQPVLTTAVAGFWIDRVEVTNDAFAAFVAATGYVTVAERPVDPALHPGLTDTMRLPGAVVFVTPALADPAGDPTAWWRYTPGASWRHPGGPGTDIEGRGAFPVVAVTDEDARAYSRWHGTVLPTEAQWEWAARGANPAPMPSHEQPKDANTWQGLFPFANSGEDGFVGLAPVGCFAPNRLGIFDMIGNVWELTADAFSGSHTPDGTPPATLVGERAANHAIGPDRMPPRPDNTALAPRVIKGGSYLCAPNYCMRYRAGARQPQDADLASSHVGFRTVLQAPAPPDR